MIDKWAAENGVTGTYESILANEKTSKFLLEEIKQKGKEAGFFGFEIPSKIHITETAFTQENDLVTPTFKLKRNDVKFFFINQIKAMYEGATL